MPLQPAQHMPALYTDTCSAKQAGAGLYVTKRFPHGGEVPPFRSLVVNMVAKLCDLGDKCLVHKINNLLSLPVTPLSVSGNSSNHLSELVNACCSAVKASTSSLFVFLLQCITLAIYLDIYVLHLDTAILPLTSRFVCV